MTLFAALAGALVGAATGLIPGVHVNTFAAFLVAAGGVPGVAPAPVASALIAAGVSSAFAGIASGTFLGAPPEESAAAALPAHTLLARGQGVSAVSLGASGALAGALVALALALPLRALLEGPIFLAARLTAALPFVMLALVVWMVASERRRIPYRRFFVVDPFASRVLTGRVSAVSEGGAFSLEDGRRVRDPLALTAATPGAIVRVRVRAEWREGRLSRALGSATAAAVFLLAGAYGSAALSLGASNPFGLPSSALLAIFAGLFGVPGLVALFARSRPPPAQVLFASPPPPGAFALAARGAFASSVLALLPGLSASHAAALASETKRDGDPERALILLGACTGGGAVFGLLALPLLGRARSGAAVAAHALDPVAPWSTLFPDGHVVAFLLALIVGALVGWWAARTAARILARLANRMRARVLATVALVWLVAVTSILGGALSLVVLATGAAIGMIPPRVGVRRSHLMGVVLLPLLVRLWS